MTAPEWRWLKHPEKHGKDFGEDRAFAVPPKLSFLIRETAQNSLDAAVPGRRVGMRFRVIDLPQGCNRRAKFEEAFRYLDLRAHINDVITLNKSPVASRFERVVKTLDRRNNTLRLLLVEDYDTVGLRGDDFDESSNYSALIRDTQNNIKDDPAAGGSYGLGSGTLWACSGLLTVLFGSIIAEQEQSGTRVIAKANLGYHEQRKKKQFKGAGYFGLKDSDEISVSGFFSQDTSIVKDLCLERHSVAGSGLSGTTALIVAFDDPDNDSEAAAHDELMMQIQRDVAENLWPAISCESLTVVTRYEYGDRYAESVDQTVEIRQWVPSFVDAYDGYVRGDVKESLQSPGDVVSVTVQQLVPATRDGAVREDLSHDETVAEARLLIRYAEPGALDHHLQDRISCSRGKGLVSHYWLKRPAGLNVRPFHAVLLAGKFYGSNAICEVADRFLRSAEPPAHDKWEFSERVKSAYVHGAKKLLNDFKDSIGRVLRDKVVGKSASTSDGPRLLKELLTMPRVIEKQTASLSIKNPSIKILGEEVVFSASLSLSKTRKGLFTPIVKIMTESGGGIPLQIEKIECSDQGIVVDNRLLFKDAGRTVSFSGTASSGVTGLDLSRCEFQFSGTLKGE